MQLAEEFAALIGTLSRRVLENAPDAQLSGAEYGLLLRLDRAGTLRPGDLATAESMEPSTLSRRLQAMEARGLVQRDADPLDRRAHLVAATAAGLDALAVERARRVRIVSESVAGWPESDRDELTRLIAKLNQSLQEPDHGR
jgi:DNA-binding MarR family transcriptional regulator